MSDSDGQDEYLKFTGKGSQAKQRKFVCLSTVLQFMKYSLQICKTAKKCQCAVSSI